MIITSFTFIFVIKIFKNIMKCNEKLNSNAKLSCQKRQKK